MLWRSSVACLLKPTSILGLPFSGWHLILKNRNRLRRSQACAQYLGWAIITHQLWFQVSEERNLVIGYCNRRHRSLHIVSCVQYSATFELHAQPYSAIHAYYSNHVMFTDNAKKLSHPPLTFHVMPCENLIWWQEVNPESTNIIWKKRNLDSN